MCTSLILVMFRGRDYTMTNSLNNNSNPSGYDTRYNLSVTYDFIAQNNITKAEIEQQRDSVKQYIQQSQSENKQEYVQELKENAHIEYIEALSEISLLKVNYIVRIIKRKLAVLHRVLNHRLLKGKKIPDSVIIEREIEKRATLNIVDMLAILKFADKNKEMSTQQKVLLMNELNKNVKLTVDEKISVVNRIILADIIADSDSLKHINNKLTLLFIVKESGFSIDVTRVKGYKPVMNDAYDESKPTEEALVTELTAEESTNGNTATAKNTGQTVELIELNKDIAEDVSQPDNPPEDTVAKNNTNTEQAKKSAKTISKLKAKATQGKVTKKPQITKAFVNSKRHFKFGAGYEAHNNTLSILLPSGYILDGNKAYQSSYMNDNVNNNVSNSFYEKQSPLSITLTKSEKSGDYSLVDFYNSNIIDCKANDFKYRNTVISKSPAVLKHKVNSNVYIASVFIREAKLVYDIKFTFKKTVANTASTVNRIIASILFKGM